MRPGATLTSFVRPIVIGLSALVTAVFLWIELDFALWFWSVERQPLFGFIVWFVALLFVWGYAGYLSGSDAASRLRAVVNGAVCGAISCAGVGAIPRAEPVRCRH
jgi:hypothetical protein